MMGDAEQQRATVLREQLAHHNNRYYGDDAPEISDASYDALVRELRDLEAKFPELAAEDSPTATVGSATNSSFAPVVHARPMQSLDNAFDDGTHRHVSLRAKGRNMFRTVENRASSGTIRSAYDFSSQRSKV